MGRNNSRRRKELRRQEAEARQDIWNNLSVDERIAQLEARGEGNSSEAALLRESK